MNVGSVDSIVYPPATDASTAADPAAAAPTTVAPADANAAVVEQLKREWREIANMEETGVIPSYFLESTLDLEPMNYFELKKKVYTPVEEILKMTPDDVAAYRKQLQIKIIGTYDVVFNPIKTWEHAGFPKMLAYPLADLQHEKPMPIQAQALPVIMSGRDCIALAGKGSGKTLAYVLPMLRHIMEATYHKPIGLVIAPNRDLAERIYQILAHFNQEWTAICSLVPVFRGNVTSLPLRMQVEPCVVVCTPETGYDARKIINYRRATFLVIDDADIIIDMGLMKQVLDIVQCTRTNCQTVVFSTTFQPYVELLARIVTMEPVEIRHAEKLDVGGGEGPREAKRLKRAAV